MTSLSCNGELTKDIVELQERAQKSAFKRWLTIGLYVAVIIIFFLRVGLFQDSFKIKRNPITLQVTGEANKNFGIVFQLWTVSHTF